MIEVHPSDDGSLIEVRSSKKRRKGRTVSGLSSETVISIIATTALAEGLTVVFVPLTTGQNISDLSSIKVSQALEKPHPECILEVRYYFRLDLIAVDTRNGMTTRALLSSTELCGVPIRAYSLSHSL